jgi:hypothetical protein
LLGIELPQGGQGETTRYHKDQTGDTEGENEREEGIVEYSFEISMRKKMSR